MSAKFHRHKHDIKEDKFVTLIFRWGNYISENWQKFVFGLIGVLAVVLVVLFLNARHQELTQVALQNFSNAMEEYKNQNYTKAEEQFKNIHDKYGSTKYGKRSLLYLGKIYVNKKEPNIKTAREYFEKASKKIDNKFLRIGAMVGIAKTYLAEGNKEKYYSSLEQITRKYKDFYKTPEYYMEIADYHYKSAQTDKAKSYYQKIVKKFEDSDVYSQAKEKLDKIKKNNMEI